MSLRFGCRAPDASSRPPPPVAAAAAAYVARPLALRGVRDELPLSSSSSSASRPTSCRSGFPFATASSLSQCRCRRGRLDVAICPAVRQSEGGARPGRGRPLAPAGVVGVRVGLGSRARFRVDRGRLARCSRSPLLPLRHLFPLSALPSWLKMHHHSGKSLFLRGTPPAAILLGRRVVLVGIDFAALAVGQCHATFPLLLSPVASVSQRRFLSFALPPGGHNRAGGRFPA